MQAGFFETDITPTLGMAKPGEYGKSSITKILDALKTRAVVFESGGERVAIAGIDSLVVRSLKETRKIREEVEKICGIKGENVMVAASHTHTGGPFFGFLPDEAAAAPPLVKELILKHSSLADPAYNDLVVKKVVTAICEADRIKEEAVLSAGSGHEDNVSFNRRFFMRGGRVFTHPGKGNPGIKSPAGPIDPEVGVLSAWNVRGEFLGCVVNFACHCTALCAEQGLISADWVYFLEKTLRSAMDKDAVIVFLNGACGDVTQVDNLSPGKPELGYRWSESVGCSIGAEAIRVIQKAEKELSGPVAGKIRLLSLGRRVPSENSLKKCRNIIELGKDDRVKTMEWKLAKERLIVDYIVRKYPSNDECEIQAIQVGPVIYLANPGELFCELGLEIKRGVDFPLVYVAELANGCAGYIPTSRAFEKHEGGYETVLTGYSNLEPGAGDRIVEESINLSLGFKPSRMPAGEKAGEFTAPWDYGTLGPDLE